MTNTKSEITTSANRLLIIGGGPAAVSICIQVVEEYRQHQLTKPLEIIVFEKGDKIGPGLPYAKSDDCYILNLPKDIMEPVYGRKGHFTEWLKSSRPTAQQDTAFPPRHYFGEYLHFLSEKIKTDARNIGISIDYRTYCEVFDVEDLGNSIKVITNQGEVIGDYLVFCTGHLPSPICGHFIDRKGYFHNPWEEKLYEKLDPGSDVVIIGTRLTAIDVVRKLFSSNHRGKVTMVSRSGILPTVLSKDIPPYTLKYLTLTNLDVLTYSGLRPLSLEKLAELCFAEINEAEGKKVLPDAVIRSYKELSPEAWLVQQIALAESGPKPWQQVLFAIYPMIPNIWAMLSMQDRKKFILQYRSTFLTYLAAFPLENAYKLQEHLKSGQLNILGGVTDIVADKKEGFSIQFEDRPPLVTKTLINATGPGYEPMMDPLYERMLKSGLLEKHEAGGIDVDPVTLQVLSPKMGKHPRIFGVGEITWGACLATTDMSRVALQSGRVAFSLTNLLAKDCPKLPQQKAKLLEEKNGQTQAMPEHFPGLRYSSFFKHSTKFLGKKPIAVMTLGLMFVTATKKILESPSSVKAFPQL